MGIKKVLLASAMFAVLAGPASAMERSGWYVGLGVGMNDVDDLDLPGTFNDIDYDFGTGVYGSVGYAFSKHWRAELEVGYRKNDADVTLGTILIPIPATGELTELTFMANLAYDIPLSNKWALGLMAGAGVDLAEFEVVGNDQDSVFAYQVGGEVIYQASTHWDLYLGYRFLGADGAFYERAQVGLPGVGPLIEHNYQKHMISLGLRYGYNEPVVPVVAAPPPPPPPPAIKQFIVFFGFNKYNLTADAQAVVAEAASAAKSQGAASIIVVGHTDTVGGNTYNQKLSEKRAGAVKDELVRLGIDAGKITASGKGETELLVQTGEGVKEPQNRRATIDLK